MTATGTLAGSPCALRYSAAGGGIVRVDVVFRPPGGVQPKEWGVRISLGAGCDRTAWRRRGQWTTYPPDHIGRLSGIAEAHPRRVVTWRDLPGPGGSNDYRSSKFDVTSAAMLDRTGIGLTWLAGEGGASRASWSADGATWRLATYSNGGSERFLDGSTAPERVRMPGTGDTRCSVRLTVRRWPGALSAAPPKVEGAARRRVE